MTQKLFKNQKIANSLKKTLLKDTIQSCINVFVLNKLSHKNIIIFQKVKIFFDKNSGNIQIENKRFLSSSGIPYADVDKIFN